MEDINHSCQIAGGARIDVGVHWRIVRYFLGNNSSFREVIITINGLHWNENDITASCIEKKKKKRASVWDNYTWQSHYKQMHCTDKTAHSLTATIKLLFPNYVYQLTSFSFSSASYLSWRFLYSNCHFSAFMASAECLVWSSWACKSESIATELSIKTASFSKHVHEPDCV